MNSKHLMIPALVAALMASAPGFAQDRDHGGDRDGRWSQNDRGNNDRGGNYDRGSNYNRDNDHNDRNDRRDGYGARGGGRGGDEGYGGGRHWDGAGPNHSWRRGDRLPSQYRSNQYVVNDWRGHNLRQPPRGYHWVQSGSDYVLAAVATGVIADLIINSR